MKAIIDWLMQHEQKVLFGFVFAIVMMIVFLALITLLLWPLDRSMLAFRLAKGYVLFWIAFTITAVVVDRIQKLLRIDLYSHINAYVISNLAQSILLLAGWSAFAALTVRSFVDATPVWVAVVLYVMGFISSYIVCLVSAAFYPGEIYRVVTIPLAAISFIVFAVWPMSGHVMYGWFFDLF